MIRFTQNAYKTKLIFTIYACGATQVYTTNRLYKCILQPYSQIDWFYCIFCELPKNNTPGKVTTFMFGGSEIQSGLDPDRTWT